jgi:hypothetical protein
VKRIAFLLMLVAATFVGASAMSDVPVTQAASTSSSCPPGCCSIGPCTPNPQCPMPCATGGAAAEACVVTEAGAGAS